MAGGGFDEFFAEQYDPVARALTLATGDRELAADAAQEAFSRALRHWKKVREMDRPSSWVYVVAMNHLRDQWRRGARHAVADVEPVDETGGVAVKLTVREAIATLPARQREAIVLRYLADLPLADVADAMGCALGTAKATIHRALRTMRVELEEDDDAN
jgi:RNA polymerase sigma-70 factor (ECF subfamily)